MDYILHLAREWLHELDLRWALYLHARVAHHGPWRNLLSPKVESSSKLGPSGRLSHELGSKRVTSGMLCTLAMSASKLAFFVDQKRKSPNFRSRAHQIQFYMKPCTWRSITEQQKAFSLPRVWFGKRGTGFPSSLCSSICASKFHASLLHFELLLRNLSTLDLNQLSRALVLN
ncbi:hypothetical protein VNO77_21879 [Canavalia gladiata]|uniref:Uncharacterized protein n=1 Tax=Canavalia gladiata TaxID=3824 RepID=A0AAN9L6R4_CANGL